MRSWVRRTEDGMRLVEVHYCAYRHPYHKPTHLWTNLTVAQWQPNGKTGLARCEGKCEGGQVSQAEKSEHEFEIAQGSWQARGGKGRKAFKNLIPKDLHLERHITGSGDGQAQGQLLLGHDQWHVCTFIKARVHA